MGSTHNLNIKAGVTFNGKDILDLHPDIVRAVIKKDKTGIVRAIIQDKMMDDEEFPLPDNYASHAGRPSLSKLPYMMSENDGYPYLPGHSPLCDGKPYHNGMCKCKYDEWNHAGGGVREIWPGMDIDDFDM
jgi:hypothetical protein